MPTDNILLLESKTLKYTGVTIQNPVPTAIPRGVTALIGPNGSGKSTLALIIERGRNFATNKITTCKPDIRIRTISFTDIHSLSGFKAGYYQQRYEATMNDEVPTVTQLFGSKTETPLWKKLVTRLRLEGVESKKINFLSSGELRKMLIINMLFDLPDLLILDNPYIGLDREGRTAVDQALQSVTADGISVMLLLCDPTDIPSYTDCVMPICDLTLRPLDTDINSLFRFSLDGEVPAPAYPHPTVGAEVFRFDHCDITHGETLLLQDVVWQVKQGECWALSGRNGSGKSTLLSLIHADNPQAYARPLYLFGNKRGSGETIWDIKRRIGYISSEMHLYFNGGNNLVVNVVAQGLNDTVGMFRKPAPEQIATALRWLRLFRLGHLVDRRFSTLSTGEQRLVLLARTLIKNPELLILDEPLHGLDSARKKAAVQAIDTLCLRNNTTLVFVTHCPSELPACVDRRFDL